MKPLTLVLALLTLSSLSAISHADAWHPTATDYVKQTAASSIQLEATNFLLLNEADYDKHLADKQPTARGIKDDRMQCLRRIQAYRCN
ncbi:MAG: hypothetical protein QE263_04145 [Vampirovibrionales bacterium]|nr:hypothetical protein [Vampirovibrionales bacterium]